MSSWNQEMQDSGCFEIMMLFPRHVVNFFWTCSASFEFLCPKAQTNPRDNYILPEAFRSSWNEWEIMYNHPPDHFLFLFPLWSSTNNVTLHQKIEIMSLAWETFLFDPSTSNIMPSCIYASMHLSENFWKSFGENSLIKMEFWLEILIDSALNNVN